MSTNTVSQIEQLIDQLSPLEQTRLLEYLSLQLRKTVASLQPPPIVSEDSLPNQWETLFRIGDNMSSLPGYGEETLTQSVTTLRR